MLGQTTYHKFEMSAFKYFTMIPTDGHINVGVYFSREKERQGYYHIAGSA